MLQRFREPVSGFSHLGGALLAVIGSVGLVLASWQTPAKMLSLLVYGGSLVAVYLASTALHLTRGSERTLAVLNRLDHAAIYGVIAGTYTPFCYNLLSGAWRWGMLIVIWALAAVGIMYMLFFYHNRRRLGTILYMAMGWIAVIVAPKLLAILPTGAVILLLAGGIVYSIGSIIFAMQWPNFHRHFGHHEIWHLFVIGGSVLQFLAVAWYVV